MLNRRGRIALHSHHIKITANYGKVDRVRVAVFKDESLRGDLAARVHRRRECPERQAHRRALDHGVKAAALVRRDAERMDERAPIVGRLELVVGEPPSAEERVPGRLLLGELSGRFVEAPDRRRVELGRDCVVALVHRGDTPVLEREERHETVERLLRLEVDVRRDFAALVGRKRIVDDGPIRVVEVRLVDGDGVHLLGEVRIVRQPSGAAADAVAGEVEVVLVLAEVPDVRVDAPGAAAANQGVERIPVNVRGLRPVGVRVTCEEKSVVGVMFSRIRRARPDASVRKLLEVLDRLAARRVLVGKRRSCTRSDRVDRHRAGVVVPLAAADEDASIKIPQAVDAARVKRRVACPCIALAKRREKVF